MNKKLKTLHSENITKEEGGLRPEPVAIARNPSILNILIKMKTKNEIL